MMHRRRGRGRLGGALSLCVLLAACGGGGGPAGVSPFPAPAPAPAPAPVPTPPPASSSFAPEGPSTSFAQQCAADNSLAPATSRTASLTREKQWLRAYFDEAYLWPQDVERVDPARFSGGTPYQAMDAYFNALTSRQRTASGALRDRFSFTIPTAEWKALTESGASAGYGLSWLISGSGGARRLRIATVETTGPAASAGLRRGDEVLSVDDIPVGTSTQLEALNAALYPPASGRTHRWRIQPRDGGAARSLTLTSAVLASDPVPLARRLDLPSGGQAGYLVFHDHNLPAERKLIEAVRDFQAAGVRELIVDLRYNGGGYLFLASQLGHMIAGSQRIAGRPFELLRYSARRSAENESTPFRSTSCVPDASFRCTDTQALPSLNLARVYVLAGEGTCSASESLINGLRGVDVEVRLIGGTTCGKPYGFTAKDNCGVSYLPIEFEGVNAKGFGDYSDGFEPATVSNGRQVPGCRVADDLSRELGDPSEAQLAAALRHASGGGCPAATGLGAEEPRRRALAATLPEEGQLRRPPARDNRIHQPLRER